MKKLSLVVLLLLCLSASLEAQTNASFNAECGGSVTSCSVTSAAGDAVVVWGADFTTGNATLNEDGVASVSVLSGYPKLWFSGVASTNLWVVRNVTAGAHTWAITNSGGDSFPDMFAVSISGTSIISPLDVAGNGSGNSASTTCATLTTTKASDVILSFATYGGGPSISLGTSSQTMTAFGPSAMGAWGIVSTASAATVGWNGSGIGQWVCDNVAIKSKPAVEPTLASIALTPTSATVSVPHTTTIAAVGTYSDGTTFDVSNQVTWVSSDSTKATVATPGVVKAVAAGSTNITASLGAVTSPASAITITPFVVVTYFVRSYGGSRFSVNVPTGQCNGTTDAPYPGTGTNQPCAFGDIKSLWTDGTTTSSPAAGAPKWGWIGEGGDHYDVGQNLSSGVDIGYRIGSNIGPNSGDCYGLCGTPFANTPIPPSGTATFPTQIYGSNFAACTLNTSKTHVNGGYGVGAVFDFANTNYVTFSCFDITDHSSCGRAGQVNQCSTSFPLSDYATNGISTRNTTTNLTMTDISIHGIASAGLIGPTGDGVSALRLSTIGNASSGWNMDAGDGTTGQGVFHLSYPQILWNGCTEEYPIVDTVPYGDCTDDNGGGYGDGIGTATTTSLSAWSFNIDHAIAAFNTQDGLDGLHLFGNGSKLTVTDSLLYSNMGQQLKAGAASTSYNNLVVTNCNAMRQAIPGTPTGYNAKLTDFCRASDTGIAIAINDGATTDFEFNTVLSATATGIEVDCNLTCSTTALMNYSNNVFLGFENDLANGYPSGGSGNFSAPMDILTINPFINVGSAYTNNLTFNQKTAWPCPNVSLDEANGLCVDPQLTDDTWHLYGFGNMTPLAGSPLVSAGLSIAGITTDYNGVTRPTPPTIGAIELAGAPTPVLTSIVVTPNPGSVVAGLSISMTCTAVFSDTSMSACVSPTWASSSTTNATVAGGSVTGVAAGSSTITASIGGVSGAATVNVTAAPPPSGFTCTVIGAVLVVGSVMLCK